MAAQTTWNWVAHHVKVEDFFFQHLLDPVEDRFLRRQDAVEIVHVHDSSDLYVECARQLRRFLQFCQVGKKKVDSMLKFYNIHVIQRYGDCPHNLPYFVRNFSDEREPSECLTSTCSSSSESSSNEVAKTVLLLSES